MKTIVSVLFVLALSACSKPADSVASAAVTPASAPTMELPQNSATPSTAHAEAQTSATFSRIVFVDKENACACTRERADQSWQALQTALSTGGKIPVERIYLDSQAAKAEVYTNAKTLMVVPGIYFVDANDKVIDLLQGEVSVTQLDQKLESLAHK